MLLERKGFETLETKICAAIDCENEYELVPHNKRYCSLTCKRKMENVRRGPLERSFYEEEDEEEEEEIVEYTTTTSSAGSYNTNTTANIQFLRSETARLTNLVNKHKKMADEMLQTMYQAFSENLKQITVNPPRRTRQKTVSSDKVLVANPSNSDTQLGKLTPTYNSDVAAERVELYTDKILETTQDLRWSRTIEKANVWFLGDIVEGEGIFPTQPHVIDSSVYEQVAKNGPTIYAAQLRRLLENFDEVHVTAIIGNHGRLSKYNNPESNMDRMLYKILEHIFAYEPRISFSIPDGNGESMFWAVDTIGNYSTLLIHGDQLPVPTSGVTYHRKILGWKSGAIPVPFDDVIMGHWHQNTKMTINQTIVRVAGSTESYNTFAQERLACMSRPSQHLQFIDPVRGAVEWESDIYLD